MLIFSILSCTALAQFDRPAPPINQLDVLVNDGPTDFRSYEYLSRDHRQVESLSSSTISKLDLKAPAKALSEYNKGMQFLMKSDFKNAVTHLAKAISVYSSFVGAHNALGCAYLDLGQNDLAREEFTKTVQLDGYVSSSYLNLGRTELALQDYPAAQVAFEKASSIAPLNTKMLVPLSYAQFLNHDYANVTKTAQRVHSLHHEGDAIVHYFAAASWQAQNNLPETQQELQTFLSEDPNSQLADQAKHILEQVKAAQARALAPNLVASTLPQEQSRRGEKVLQGIEEKKQIAEAETVDPTCETCVNHAEPAEITKDQNKLAHNFEGNGWTLRSNVDEVAVVFTATDHGKSVAGLTQKELTIRDDQKVPAAILGLRSESELPLCLGLLVDTSASITSRFAFEQSAATNFMRKVLTGKDDLAFVVGFSNSVQLMQDFTGDQQKIARGIDQLAPTGGTAIWDAVSFAADKLASRRETQPVARILIVVSDGDNNSSQLTLKQAIEHAQRDEVIVYAVSTSESGEEEDDSSVGNHAMRTLAELTGGRAFFPGWSARLNRSLEELQQVIHNRYMISYRPALFQRDGRYRSIDITAQKSGHKLRVYARKGYFTTIDETNETEDKKD
jgi:VWFA-related protein